MKQTTLTFCYTGNKGFKMLKQTVDGLRRKLNYVETQPLSGTIGLEIKGIDLSQQLTVDEEKFIHAALLQHLVLFFSGQDALSAEQLSKFSSLFGEIDLAHEN